MDWSTIHLLSDVLEPRTRVVFLVIWLTNAPLHLESIASLVWFFKFLRLYHKYNKFILSTEETCDVFGSKLREQVEDRLKFYESGDIPRKNVDVMHEALTEAQAVLVIESWIS